MKIYPFIVVLILVLLKLRVNAYPVPTSLVANVAAKGAVCLDGSPPAYHFYPSFDSGVDNWLVHMEYWEEGWCGSIEECLDRQNNFRGTSPEMKPLSFSGNLGNQLSSNPGSIVGAMKVQEAAQRWSRRVKVRGCGHRKKTLSHVNYIQNCPWRLKEG